MIDSEKMQALLENEEIMNQVMTATSLEAEVEILHENGIEITVDELKACGDEGMAVLKDAGYIGEDGELSMEMLENVSGGKGLSIGGKMIVTGVGMSAVALASDYLAGACAVALVSNPVGWFFGGIAVATLGVYVLSRSKK